MFLRNLRVCCWSSFEHVFLLVRMSVKRGEDKRVHRLHAPGSFSSSGLDESKFSKITASQLINTNDQIKRVIRREKASTSRFISNQEKARLNSRGAPNNMETIKASAQPFVDDSSEAHRFRLRQAKERELAAKLEYLQKLKQRDSEVIFISILKIPITSQISLECDYFSPIQISPETASIIVTQGT
jgi:hypothetical protein